MIYDYHDGRVKELYLFTAVRKFNEVFQTHQTKRSDVIQPDGFAVPLQSLEPLVIIFDLKCTLGKTKQGGMLIPMAEMRQQAVTSVPLSVDVMCPTLFTAHCSNDFHRFLDSC